MPTFEVTISDAALVRLQAVVAHYNENTGQSLTVKQWALRHLKEIAVGQELGAAVQELEKQRDQAHNAAVNAKFEELLAALGDE